ncbi:GCN5-related N-acetyltransferase protein [Rutstroemia sp. NJR-2017a BBW]|nr:GCN5-related N-acetyltransferase protein [Rutstroemia sp. NJR-2017a BBW]
MHIRPVTRNDISKLADIAVAAFRNDEVYSSFFPASAVESGAFRRSHLLRMRKRIVDVGMRGFVVESDEDDDFWNGEKDILGYAFWSRTGTSEAARKWQTDSLYMKLERGLIASEDWYSENFQDRDRDWEKIRQFRNLLADNFASVPEYLELATLGVNPKYHRRGIGGKLVQWGIDAAKEEHIPVVLEGSVSGTKLYSKMGFHITGTDDVDGVEVVAMSSDSSTAVHTPHSDSPKNKIPPTKFNHHSNKNGPDERYQINEDLLYEYEFPGETYVSAHLQRLQHGVYTDANLHTKHPKHVTFVALSFTMHASQSTSHRFESAIITVKASSEDGERLRFLKFAPHLAYGRMSSESLKWNFQLGAALGVTQGPATASVKPSVGYEQNKVVGTMMKMYVTVRFVKGMHQGSTRSTFSQQPGHTLQTRHVDTHLHWSLEENAQQEDGLPREFTFVFLVERSSPKVHQPAHTFLSRHSTPAQTDQHSKSKFKNALTMRLKTAGDNLKDNIHDTEKEIAHEVEPMKYSDQNKDDPLRGRDSLCKDFVKIFTPLTFEIEVKAWISASFHKTVGQKSIVAGEVGQRFPTEGTEESWGKKEHPEVMVDGMYNFAKMGDAFEDMVSLPGKTVTTKVS